MEFEQIIKRLEWLDEERRKDKDRIATLEARQASLETSQDAFAKLAKEIQKGLARLSSLAARLDQFEHAVAKQRQELVGRIEETRTNLETENEKHWKNERQRVNRALAEMRKSTDAITEMARNLAARAEEESHLARLVTQVQKTAEEITRANEETQRAVKVLEENRRQDTKRLGDAQGELSASRKRVDELREKMDVHNDSIRRLENRLNEMLAAEAERKQAQAAFFDQQTRLQVQRDQGLKDWKESYDKLTSQSEKLTTQLAEWDAIQRAAKRAQESYEEMAGRFERRINEISEMQRLAEDRFRQEWVTFKTDEQKRWTGFSLSQEEQQKDNRSSIEKMNDRLTAIEDLSQTQQDILDQGQEAQTEYLQGLLAQIHELLSAYERIAGAAR